MSNENECTIPRKRRFDQVTVSPVRENLLSRVSQSPKKTVFHHRYIPTHSNENNEDSCKQMVNTTSVIFDNFRFAKRKLFCRDSESIRNMVNAQSNSVLRAADSGSCDNIESRKQFEFYSNVLTNELIHQSPSFREVLVSRSQHNAFMTPVKTSPFRMLDFSPKQYHSSEGIFDKSPGTPLKSGTKDAILSPPKSGSIPHQQAYKVLDAPGIADDFYLKLLDWSSDNQIAVALNNKVYLYNFETEKVVESLSLSDQKDSVTSISWNKVNKSQLLVGTSKGKIQLQDVEYSKILGFRWNHADRIGVLDWVENCFTTGSKDKQIMHFDVRETHESLPVCTFNKHSHEICGLTWSPGGNILASGGNDNKLILWSLHSTKPMCEFRSHMAAIRALSWSPHEHGVLASGGGSADRSIKIWNTLTFNLRHSITTSSQICNLVWSPYSKQLLTTHGYNDNSISIWNYPGLESIVKLKGHTSRVLQMSLSADGRDVVTAAGDETVRFWRVFENKSFSKKKTSKVFNILPAIR